MQPFLVVIFALFGLVFGSFANVLIYRIPRHESVAFPGSHCPHCQVQLAWYDNIPVLSWLLLRGQCRTCHSPISKRYPLVEIAGGCCFAIAPLISFNIMQAITVAGFLYLLMVLSIIDLETRTLPNPLVASLGVLGLLGVVFSSFCPPESALINAGTFSSPHTVSSGFTSVLPLFSTSSQSPAWLEALLGVLLCAGPAALLALLYWLIRKQEGFGMGDIKLLAVIGLFLGSFGVLVLPVAAVLGLVGIILMRLGNREVSVQTKIPFGPFIALASLVILTVGPAAWQWYLSLF